MITHQIFIKWFQEFANNQQKSEACAAGEQIRNEGIEQRQGWKRPSFTAGDPADDFNTQISTENNVHSHIL